MVWCIQSIPNRNRIGLKVLIIQTDVYVATLMDMRAHHLPIFSGTIGQDNSSPCYNQLHWNPTTQNREGAPLQLH